MSQEQEDSGGVGGSGQRRHSYPSSSSFPKFFFQSHDHFRLLKITEDPKEPFFVCVTLTFTILEIKTEHFKQVRFKVKIINLLHVNKT